MHKHYTYTDHVTHTGSSEHQSKPHMNMMNINLAYVHAYYSGYWQAQYSKVRTRLLLASRQAASTSYCIN